MTYFVFKFCSGLFKKIGELVEAYDPHGEFDIENRINLDIYAENSQNCTRGEFIT